MAKPAWARGHIPALDGLRGIAIVLVLLHHCAPRLVSLGLGTIADWGWIGVNLFFVLSGFLITGILLDERGRPHFFRNFYARRALRIWPMYALVVLVNITLYGRVNTWDRSGPMWFYFVFMIQNLTPGLTGTIYPTWSVAIEEQFYLVWAPLARFVPRRWLAVVLLGTMAIGPWMRGPGQAWFVPVYTLYHLDGLAMGGLLALAIRQRNWNQATWGKLGWVLAGIGGLAATLHQGPWLNTELAVGFSGWLIAAATGRGAVLTLAPLRFLGKISYGLYLIHMPVFAILGSVDVHMDRIHAGAWGDLTIVAMRWAISIAAASLLWYGFERPILQLKRYFRSGAVAAAEAAVVAEAR